MTPQDFLFETHLHVFENLKISDQKATAFIAIDSAVLAGLFGANLLILKNPTFWVPALSITSFLTLSLAVVFGGLALWPRLKDSGKVISGGELTIPSKISKLELSPKQYLEAVTTACDQLAADEQFAALLLARVQSFERKDFWLKASIMTSGLGLILAGLFVFVRSYFIL